MATYFVRIGGNDSNAGTSAGAAWRTIQKALGATGIGSGDTVWIGAGVYREAVTVAMTSATVETFVIGDVDGAMTGDAGEVIWTNYLTGWQDSPSGDCLNLAGRSFLTFRSLHLIAAGTGNCLDATTTHSAAITLDQCVVVAYGASPIIVTTLFATALTWSIRRSYVASLVNANTIVFTLTTGVGADYDVNAQITDSFVWCVAGSAIQVTAGGTAANRGGGVDVLRCTLVASPSCLVISSANLSATIPCTIGDSLLFGGAGSITASVAAQVTDLGGNVLTGQISTVIQHPTTKTSNERFPAPLLSFGHEWLWGLQPRRFLGPLVPGLARGMIGTATTDLENRIRSEGNSQFIDSGSVTSATTQTLTDTSKTWKTNEHTGRLVRVASGYDAVKKIISNTATALTVSGGASTGTGGVWPTTPVAGSLYTIYEGPPTETNKATSGTTTTFVCAANWSSNKWSGYDAVVVAGTNVGLTRSVVSNTSNTLVTAAFPTAIDATTVVNLVWPGSTPTAVQPMIGALGRHDSADRETTTTDAGGVGIHLDGPGSVGFDIPVDPASTTITVKARYDLDHGTTTKPQALLLANGEIGVAAQTVTMTVGAVTWETLSFTPFTPTAPGVVTVRLVSRSVTPYGRSYFDSFTVV